MDSEAPEKLATLTYNKLGEVLTKKVGQDPSDAGRPLQTMDFSYNIRGWLSKLNNLTLDAPGENDLFGIELSYQEAGSHHNGNLTQMQWRSASDGVLRGYSYQYKWKWFAATPGKYR